MMVMVSPALWFSLAVLVVSTSGPQKQLSLDGIIHHGLICSLFLLLDRQHRILAYLRSGISGGVGVLEGHERLLIRRLFQLLILRPLDQSVNTPLSQQVSLHFFRSPGLATRGSIIHPIHAGASLLSARSFLQVLEFLNFPLLGSLFHDLINLFAFFEGFLFLFPYLLLVAHEHRVC